MSTSKISVIPVSFIQQLAVNHPGIQLLLNNLSGQQTINYNGTSYYTTDQIYDQILTGFAPGYSRIACIESILSLGNNAIYIPAPPGSSSMKYPLPSPTTSWNYTNSTCVQIRGTQGTFGTISECQAYANQHVTPGTTVNVVSKTCNTSNVIIMDSKTFAKLIQTSGFPFSR